MSVINSPNMNLPVPTVGTQNAPLWAQNINSCLSAIDSHDHTAGQGVQIPSAGININADLPFNGENATLLRSIRLSVQTVALALATDLSALYSVGTNGELYYNDQLGNQVQITSNGQVNATTSVLSNPPASAAFVSSVLTVLSSGTTRAAIDAGAYILRYSGSYPTPAGNAIVFQAPAALSGSYALTFPLALPSSQKIVTIDSSGNIAANYTVDGSTIQIISNVIKVPNQGITATQIATNTITAVQIAGGTITDSLIAAGTISGAKIASATITGSNIAGNTVSAANIVGATITSAQIATGTITGSNIGTNTITATNIAASTIPGANLVSDIALAGTSVTIGTGYYVMTSKESPLVTIRGYFNGATGAIINGAGFTVTASPNFTAPTSYTVTFTTPFSAPPAVVANSVAGVTAYPSAATTSTVVINKTNNSQENMMIIAIGPR